MDELKPCPFCGNKAEIHYTSSQSFATTKFFVGCNVCGVETPRIARTRKEAIITWNRRPALENKPLTLEQLRQTIEYDPKGWLWLEDLTDGENSTYQRNDKTFRWSNLTNYGKTWLAYTRKPEKEEK